MTDVSTEAGECARTRSANSNDATYGPVLSHAEEIDRLRARVPLHKEHVREWILGLNNSR